MRSLQRLGRTANSSLVDSSRCTTNETSTDLFCNFTNSTELIVNDDTGVALQEVKLQICLCDSAMAFEYTLTNGTVVAHNCSQCPVPVQIDQLSLENNFNVYVDDFDITRIAVLVSTVILSCVGVGGKAGGERESGDCMWWTIEAVIPLPTSAGSGLRSGEIA